MAECSDAAFPELEFIRRNGIFERSVPETPCLLCALLRVLVLAVLAERDRFGQDCCCCCCRRGASAAGGVLAVVGVSAPPSSIEIGN